MNKYSYNWRDSMRLRAGLTWRTNKPSMSDYPSFPKYALCLLIVLLCWGWAMDMDYAEEMAAEAERKGAVASQRTKELADCLNGTAKFVSENQKSAVVCRKAEHFDI